MKVIFACVHNAVRSQMAAAFFNAFADPEKAHAISGGTQPAECVHPQIVEVMKEIDIDLSGIKPRLLTDEIAQDAQILVTMGCGHACSYLPGIKRDDWPLPDPKGKSIERVREIRDNIRHRIQKLVDKLHVSKEE